MRTMTGVCCVIVGFFTFAKVDADNQWNFESSSIVLEAGRNDETSIIDCGAIPMNGFVAGDFMFVNSTTTPTTIKSLINSDRQYEVNLTLKKDERRRAIIWPNYRNPIGQSRHYALTYQIGDNELKTRLQLRWKYRDDIRLVYKKRVALSNAMEFDVDEGEECKSKIELITSDLTMTIPSVVASHPDLDVSVTERTERRKEGTVKLFTLHGELKEGHRFGKFAKLRATTKSEGKVGADEPLTLWAFGKTGIDEMAALNERYRGQNELDSAPRMMFDDKDKGGHVE